MLMNFPASLILGALLVFSLIAWFFIRRWNPEKTRSEFFELKGKGAFEVAIVGESFYQKNLQSIAASLGKKKQCVAYLLCEDNNPHDKNAVAVMINNLQVGHLSRHLAPIYRNIIRDEGFGKVTGVCKAKLYGGTKHKPSIGVWIDI